MTLSDLSIICGRTPGNGFPVFVREQDGKEWEIKELETTHHTSEKGTVVKHVIVLKECSK